MTINDRYYKALQELQELVRAFISYKEDWITHEDRAELYRQMVYKHRECEQLQKEENNENT
jgi:hypothetical protein